MEMFDMGRRYSVMAMATIPLAPWASGMVRSDVLAMEKEIGSMREERKARRLMAMRMARETLIMLESEREQHRRYREGVVPAYRKGLDAAMASYQEGSGDLFRVLDIWDRWVMARMAMLEHSGKALVLEAEYERESGK
jgi:outer membrane protein TolC